MAAPPSAPITGIVCAAAFCETAETEPRGDLSNQPHEHGATFLNDAAFSNEAGSFRDRSRKNPTHNEIAALRSVICLSPTAQSKDFNA